MPRLTEFSSTSPDSFEPDELPDGFPTFLAAHASQLTSLRLSGDSLSPILSVLAGVGLPCLTSLRLSDFADTTDEVRALLKAAPSLTDLSLCLNLPLSELSNWLQLVSTASPILSFTDLPDLGHRNNEKIAQVSSALSSCPKLGGIFTDGENCVPPAIIISLGTRLKSLSIESEWWHESNWKSSLSSCTSLTSLCLQIPNSFKNEALSLLPLSLPHLRTLCLDARPPLLAGWGSSGLIARRHFHRLVELRMSSVSLGCLRRRLGEDRGDGLLGSLTLQRADLRHLRDQLVTCFRGLPGKSLSLSSCLT